MLLKVGELARRAGLTVRALHHYDSIGLLRPSARSDSGYRLYSRDDVERLHCIQTLRRMGLALADVARMLDGGSVSLPEDNQIVELNGLVATGPVLSLNTILPLLVSGSDWRGQLHRAGQYRDVWLALVRRGWRPWHRG